MEQTKGLDKEALLLQGLIIALTTGNPQDMITSQEQDSQQKLVLSHLLPSRLEPKGAKEFLEKMGVNFLNKEDDVSLFQDVILPAGWQKATTPNPWLSMLLDHNRREIARIFYKGTSYEQNAALIVQPRYGIWEGDSENIRNHPEQDISATVIDGGTVMGNGDILFMTEPQPSSPNFQDRFRTLMRAKTEARNWLYANLPDWQNPYAYWQM